MKKITLLIFILMLSFSFAACEKIKNEDENNSDINSSDKFPNGGNNDNTDTGNGNDSTNNDNPGNNDNSGNNNNGENNNNGGESNDCVNHIFEETDSVLPTNNMVGYRYEICKMCGHEKAELLAPLAQNILSPTASISEFAVQSMQKALLDSKELFEDIKNDGNTDIFNFPLSGVADYLIIREFTLKLISDCKTETEKAKKIYEWIVTNIEYDDNYTFATVFETFTDKKAVCFGYTALMHDMLSAAGIMSVYASGLAHVSGVENNFSYNNVFNSINNPSELSHAWIILYVDNNVFICDPTWHSVFNTYNGGFGISTEEIAKTHLVLNINALTVIPDSADARLYTDAFVRLGEKILPIHNGELSSGGNVIRNSIEFNLISAIGDIFSEDTIPGEIISNGFFIMSEQDFAKDNVGYWKYSLPDGRSYEYSIILTYAFSMKHFCNIEIDIERSGDFILDNGVMYRRENGGLTVFGYVGTDKDIVIPGKVAGLNVLKIGANAFRDNNVIETVTIGAGITAIDTMAFDEAENLKSVILPSTLKTIEALAFSYTKLTEVIIPEGLETLSGSAFMCNYFLKKVTLPSTLSQINTNPFYYCAIEEIIFEDNAYFKLTNGALFTKDGKTLILYPVGNANAHYTVPTGTEIISFGAFQNAKNIKSVFLPDSLKTICESAFEACELLEGIVIPDSVTEIGPNAFNHCYSLTDVTLSESLSVIDSIFQFCYSLESIHLPASVSSVKNTFVETFSLKSITVDEGNPYFKAVNNVLYSKDGKTLICYPAGKDGDSYTVLTGTKTLYYNAFYGTKLETIILPEGLTEITSTAFIANEYLSTLVLPSTLETMLDLPALVGEAKVFCSFAESDIPDEVNIPYSANVYWLGEWEFISGIPTPKA